MEIIRWAVAQSMIERYGLEEPVLQVNRDEGTQLTQNQTQNQSQGSQSQTQNQSQVSQNQTQNQSHVSPTTPAEAADTSSINRSRRRR